MSSQSLIGQTTKISMKLVVMSIASQTVAASASGTQEMEPHRAQVSPDLRAPERRRCWLVGGAMDGRGTRWSLARPYPKAAEVFESSLFRDSTLSVEERAARTTMLETQRRSFADTLHEPAGPQTARPRVLTFNQAGDFSTQSIPRKSGPWGRERERAFTALERSVHHLEVTQAVGHAARATGRA